MDKSEWTAEEINLLQTKYPTFLSKKWKKLAIQFNRRGYERDQKELKKKWGYINSSSNDHKKWKYIELKNLYESVYCEGSNWSLIRKKLCGRSCMKVKNTFYGTMRRFLSIIFEKIQQNEPNSFKFYKILPLTCLLVFQGKQKFSSLGDSILKIFKSLNFNFDKTALEQYMLKNPQEFSQVIKVIKENKSSVFLSPDISEKSSQSQSSDSSQYKQRSENIKQVIVLSTSNTEQKIMKSEEQVLNGTHAAGYRSISTSLQQRICEENVKQQQAEKEQNRKQQIRQFKKQISPQIQYFPNYLMVPEMNQEGQVFFLPYMW